TLFRSEDEAVKLGLAARVDVGEELVEPLVGPLLGAQHLLASGAGRLLALARLFLPPFEDGELHRLAVLPQPEHVRGRPEQALVEEELDLLGPQPFDVQGPARNEVLELLDRLRGTDQFARATTAGVFLAGFLVHLAHGRRPADRAHGRELERLAVLGALVEDYPDDLRDDVARTLDHNRIPDADVDPVADRLAER